MSKIGKKIIEFDKSKVNVTVDNGGVYNAKKVTVKGPKGELTLDLRPNIEVEVTDSKIEVKRKDDQTKNKSLHGLYRSLINNMIQGVVTGFTKKLEIHGVGYRGAQAGRNIDLSLGYSHKVLYKAPELIDVKMIDETTIEVSGADRQMVGQVASEIRSLRKPEPYKGKGIRYAGEYVRKKAGKAAAK